MDIKHKYLERLEVRDPICRNCVYFDERGEMQCQPYQDELEGNYTYHPDRNPRPVYRIVGDVPDQVPRNELIKVITRLADENRRLKQEKVENDLEYKSVSRDNTRLLREILEKSNQNLEHLKKIGY